jgi:hypothetical protein
MKPGALILVLTAGGFTAAHAGSPDFSPVQPETFSAANALSNAFADVDGDDDLDLVVSFTDGALRLYLNGPGGWAEATSMSGLPGTGPEVRGLSWGDFDADGDPDLHAGVSPEEGVGARNLVFSNDGRGVFTEVGEALGLVLAGADSRQANWIDYDGDGDLDLFSAQRSSRNRLFRNDGGRFTDVSEASRLDDARRTVGACWFDMDQDGDPDLFLANQEGEEDALFRNEGGVFTIIAPQFGMNQPGRSAEEGGVGCTVGDYDNDGLLDLFVATYGNTLLYRNLGDGKFREVAAEAGVQRRLHAVGASWGDADNDGNLDLFVAAYDDTRSRNYLFMNRGGRFVDVLDPDGMLQASDHGVQWADFDRDGDLDLSLTETFPDESRHRLFRNELPREAAQRSLEVRVLDRAWRATQAGAEVRLYAGDGRLLGTRLVPTGDGYGSQGDVPVHFGLAAVAPVTVEVTFLTHEGRMQKRIEGVDPRQWTGRALVVTAD